MKHWNIKKIGKNTLLMAIVLAAAVFVCLQLSKLNDDNNPFAVSIFILAVAVIARFTEGYVFGIVSAAIGVICVNYMFTKPFFEFNFSITGYPLTFTMMILDNHKHADHADKESGKAQIRGGKRKNAQQPSALGIT